MCETLDNAIKYGLDFINKGNTASYIPELRKVDPHQLGISILQSDGSSLSSGDYDRKFTIQSISKTVALMLALMDRGQEYVFDKVGMEPTGDAFNSIIKLEIRQPSIPLNPMINAGAIAIDSLIEGNDINHKFNRLICFFRKICHNDSLWYNEKVYLSEKATGFRNRALANFIKDSGVLEGEVEEVLDLYFKQCSIEIDCRDIAMLGAVLAMDGISPITGKTLISKNICRIVKTLMVTCGMYDASGEFSIKVGIPAKSGVGGGIMAAVPGKMGIGVFGPALDKKGNSIGGIKVLEYLSCEMDLNIF
ncbi:glutaminase A [Clostridium estertheticum]|uniref:glutaminase A n=1 Tax=Clostridium estertheticum TaxID=238834 RepID=UPI001C7CED40|nr:glutaminase A [Clostridium estertheticum]MBX4261240.1 glutaminase A [Clostridium estertheticum]WLC71720.1 glutaminase A [Clostridium estertheticum]